MNKIKNTFYSFLEVFGAVVFLVLCKLLGLDLSSRMGGFLAEKIGPKLKRDKIARKNLKMAMQELNEEETDKIIQKLWNNVGRTFAEYAHLNKFQKPSHHWRTEIIFSPAVRALVDHKEKCLFVSGHFTNWELMPAISKREDFTLVEVYKRMHNPYINYWLRRQRSKHICTHQMEKTSAVRSIIRHVREKNSFAILVDQKAIPGIWAWFFNQPALTSKFPASMALKQNYILVPARIERLEGTKVKFRITLEAPLKIDYKDKTEANIISVSQQINYFLEVMIREQPQNWLWFHNKWPDPGPQKAQARKFLQGLQ